MVVVGDPLAPEVISNSNDEFHYHATAKPDLHVRIKDSLDRLADLGLLLRSEQGAEDLSRDQKVDVFLRRANFKWTQEQVGNLLLVHGGALARCGHTIT